MRRKPCVFKNVAAQMLSQGIDIPELSATSGIEYKSLCKKLNGAVRMTLDEAIRIYFALDRPMPMEHLFYKEDRKGRYVR